MYQQPKKSKLPLIFGLGCGIPVLLVMLLSCVAVVASSGNDTTVEAPASDPSVEEVDDTTSEEEAAEEESENETLSAGTYVVGEDIEPGTYRTDGPADDSFSGMCYWARLSGLSGEFDELIANDAFEGQTTVEVNEGDVALELTGECVWERQQ